MKSALRLSLACLLALCACPSTEVLVGNPDASTTSAPPDASAACQPQCDGKECGLDGCGGLCGSCTGNQGCNQATGQCLCMPQCEGKQCGTDGCGGLCGTCSGGLLCNSLTGVCAATCTPACGTRACGDDGCGGSCGECTGGKVCETQTGQCAACSPRCDGTTCGADGCGGVCTCASGTTCDPATGLCGACTQQCGGKQCGPDGCGGECGTCSGSLTCNTLTGQCAATCTPACGTRVCGDDGCQGSCGDCTGGKACDLSTGQCTCTPACDGTTCGSDGCGGTCSCADGSTCDSVSQTCSTCTRQCGSKQCGPDGCGGSCGDCPEGDSCLASGQCSGCAAACSGRECGAVGGCDCGSCSGTESCNSSGECVCTPQCGGKTCGPDGCGGSCGTCETGGPCTDQGQCPGCAGVCGAQTCGAVLGCPCGTCTDPATCDASGQCVCTPACTGKECGADGCGGSCGTCPDGKSCDANGQCVCAPACGGKECGSDGCGGSCGECGQGEACDTSTGLCACAPSCGSRACGPDGCGGVCGTCGDHQTCDASTGECRCVPDCGGKTCGDDGCGGSCGTCSDATVCSAGACVECAQDGDCGSFAAPRCLVPGNVCVGCLDAGDCAAPTAVCHDHACVGCGADGDCAAPLGRCGPALACVQCLSDSDCPGGTCDPARLACLPANDRCATPTALQFVSGVASVDGDNTVGTNDGTTACGGYYGNDLVYSFHLSSSKVVGVELAATGAMTLTPIVSLRTACDEGSEITCGGGSNPGDTAVIGQTFLQAGDYLLWVDGLVDNAGNEGTKGPFTLTVTATDPPAAPDNDSCAGTVTRLSFTGDSARAPGESSWAGDHARGSCGGAGGADVVYSFTLDADRSATVKVVGDPSTPSYRPLFYLRTACDDASIGAERGCSAADTYNSSDVAQHTYPLLAKGTYYLWVDSNGAGGKFAVFVDLGAPGAPLNDFCAQAAPLDFSAGNTVSLSGTTAGANGDTLSGCSRYDDNFEDLVWTFTTTDARRLSASVTTSGGWEPALFLRSACGAASSELACSEASYVNSTSLQLGWLPAGTYWLWLDGSSRSSWPNAGDFSLTVTLDPADPSAAGDTCASPQPLGFSGDVATTTGKTTYAANSGSGTCATSGAAYDVVWAVTTAARGSLSISLAPNTPSYQPAFYLRRSCSSTASADEVVCGAAPSAGATATQVLNDLPAGTYYLWVDGAGGTAGDYTLTLTRGAVISPPPNDLCSGALALTQGGSVLGQTVAAGDQYGQGPFSAICSAGANLSFPGPDVVYVYTPSASGNFTVTLTPAAGFDAALWATSPTCGGTGLNCIDLSNKAGAGGAESLTVAGTAGTAYYFVVDAASAAGAGQFSIGVQ